MKQILSLNYAMVLANADAFELNHPSTIYTNDNVEVLTGANTDEVEAKLIAATISVLPTLPDVGMEVIKDKLYLYNGTVYRCEQTHIRMAYTPDQTLALFSVFRKETTGLAWITGEKIVLGAKRTYNGKEYECIQAHVSQTSWNPELTLGTLWKLVTTSTEWAVGVSYKVGDIVTYNGNTYKCLQAHTSISTWTPIATPALWQKQ